MALSGSRFTAVVMPHLDSAFNLARWLARSDQDAEDIVQEACLRAFRFFDGFHGEDARPWLLGIVRNTFFTWYRQSRGQRLETPFDEALHGGPDAGTAAPHADPADPESLLLQKDRRRRVNEALAALAVEFREVLVLREIEDLSYKQIAAIVGIPMGTVMSRLARGRKQLAEVLGTNEAG